MLEDLIKELQELKEYKKKYEQAEKDKQRMSDMLYEYMMDEYNRTPYEERARHYICHWCSCCMFRPYGKDKCDAELPEDIRIPIKSSNAWIPGKKQCCMFEWD